MKTIVSFFVLLFAFSQWSFAQPAEFNYQTVVRNGQGQPITNQNISMRMSIRIGTASGDVVYQETHSLTTNNFGLANLQIGNGNSSEDISNVDWASNNHYLQVEVDPDGGSNYTNMGTTQLLSVPYARHAETASNVDDADADPTNELQNLSLDGSTLSISNGNSVTLPEVPDFNEDAMAKAWVNFPIVGQPNLTFDAYNVQSTSVVNTGVRAIQLAPGLFSPGATSSAVCQIRNDLAPGFCTVVGTAGALTVRTFNRSGQPADKEFSLVVFGKSSQ